MMKKSLVAAALMAVFAVSSFAQPATPAEMGARLVAERDAEWNRTHSGGQVQEPMAMHHDHHHQHAKRAKAGEQVKHAKHHGKRHAKHQAKHHGKHHGKKNMMKHEAAPVAQ